MADKSHDSGDHDLTHQPRQSDTSPMRQPRKLLILVMGATGTGKSTLISRITRQPAVIGNGLRSCTSATAGWDFDYSTNVRVTLVDTPGFGEDSRSDLEILEDIVRFISSPRRPPLAGVIFCHKITDVRLTGSSRQTIRILTKMCGSRFMPHVVFATTMWDTIAAESDKTKYLSREAELKRSDVGWGEFTDRYASTEQYLGDTASAMRILDEVLFNRPPLRIMNQVDRGMTIEETDAGQAITEEIRRLAQRQRREEEEDLREQEKERDRLREVYQQASTSSHSRPPQIPPPSPRLSDQPPGSRQHRPSQGRPRSKDRSTGKLS